MIFNLLFYNKNIHRIKEKKRMKRGKIKQIEAKARLGLPLTDEEKTFYAVFAKVIKREVISGTTNI